MEDLKIYVLGASGVGKSTLAKALSEKFGSPHFDSDDYYHYPSDPPYQRQRSPQDRLSLLMADLAPHRSWVLSGGAAVWDPAPAVHYSLVVFLYLPPAVRLERLRRRERSLYGSRIDRGGDMEKDHAFFMEWTAGYDDGRAEGTNVLPRHLDFLARVKAPVLKIETPMTTPEQVDLVLGSLGRRSPS